MNHPAKLGDIVSCAAIAGVCGGAATGSFVAIGLLIPGPSSQLIVAAVLAAIFGMFLSLFTAWPLGALIGCLATRAMGSTPLSAAVAGLATSLTMFGIALGGELLRSGFGLTEGLWLGSFCLIGAASALVGYRAVIGPVFNWRQPDG